MKNKTLKQISLLVLSLLLLVGACFAITASADDTSTPEIFSQNVKYTDKFCLMYAVKADTVSGGEATLYLYDEEPTADSEAIKVYTVNKVTSAADSGAAYDAYIFTVEGVSATALDKVFYVQAVDKNGNESEVKSYSVVEYLYSRLADETRSEKQDRFYKGIIAFGTGAQENLLEDSVLATTTLISDYCYVTTDGCTINGKTSAVLPQNKAFTVIGNDGALSNCTVTSYNTYDTTGTATEEEIAGSSVTISGFYRAHIAAGTSKTYKPGTENFEGYAVGDKPVTYGTYNGTSLLWANWGTLAKSYSIVAEDTVYGKTSNVLPITFMDGWIHIYPVCNEVAASEASAFEISLDMKLDTSKFDFDGKGIENLIMSMSYIAGNQEIGKVNFKELRGSDNVYEVAGNTTTLKTTDWNSIRLVFRTVEGSARPKIDIYLNNDTDTPTYTVNANKDFDVKNMNYIRFMPFSNDHEGNVTVSFDNIYCGFIK